MSAGPAGAAVISPRAVVGAMPAYRAGRTARDVARERGLDRALRLASNESPYGPLPSVRAAITDATRSVNRYPDVRSAGLSEAIAAHLGVRPGSVTVGAGSVGLLFQLAEAYLDPGDEIVTPTPTFEGYGLVATLMGARHLRVPSRRVRADVDALAAAITDRARLVVLAEPNNPTGTCVGADAVEQLAAATSGRCLLVLDEAYLEFATGPDQVDSLGLARRHPHVVVLRTFSKAHGLAGLRVGYAIATPEVIGAVERVGAPFAVNALAQVAAGASLDAGDELSARVQAIVRERQELAGQLRRRGWSVPDPRANFVWLPVGDRSDELATAFEERGVIVRPISGAGIRVTVGDRDATQRFLAAFDAIVARIDCRSAWQLPVGAAAAVVTAALDALDGLDVAPRARDRARALLTELGPDELVPDPRQLARRVLGVGPPTAVTERTPT